jgi:hypothetical protein
VALQGPDDPSCPAVSDVEVTPPGATTALTIPADDPSFAPCGDGNPADATPVTLTQFQPSPLLPG